LFVKFIAMKKTLLLLAAGAFALNASAQSASKSLVFGENAKVSSMAHKKALPANRMSPTEASRANGTANKTTAVTERWYSFYDMVSVFESQDLNDNAFVFPIFFDSTVVVNYLSGPSAINFGSVMQLLDVGNPNGLFNDPGLYPGEMQITATDNYKVDSIYLRAAYVANVDRPGTIVDTLILSVAPATNASYRVPRSYNNTGDYIPADKDTLYAFTQLNVDSVNRCLFSDVTGSPRAFWKFPLDISRRDTESSTGFPTQYFDFAVPSGGLNIPAGNAFSFSYTFKSGDTWNANVDSVNTLHQFMPIASEYANNAQMPYYYFTEGERSLPGMMFTTSPDSYVPTVYIEIINSIDFSMEFFDMGAKVVCTSCEGIVGVKNQPSLIGRVGNAYPNPATGEVRVPFTMQETADVNVTITNTLGQVLKSQNVGKVNAGVASEASFNVSDLATGMYFYTVEANGQRITNRLAVTH
jgi:hypothetical protein